MIIEVYGDSYVYGGGLNWEYALKKGYIEQYFDFKKVQTDKEKHDEVSEFLLQNRWTSKLEKDLNIKFNNNGFPGHGWQYIHYYFLNNEILNKEKKEEKIYIFCPPRISFKRLLIDVDFNKENWNIMTGKNFSDLNMIIYNVNDKELIKQTEMLNNIFTDYVTDQLNFQNVFAILNYLVANKKKFIFLPSWQNSLRNSFIFKNKEEIKKFYNSFEQIKSFVFFGFNKKLSKEYETKKEIYNFYQKFIFNHIDDIVIENFWNKPEYELPSGHPNLIAQDLIKDEYLKIIKKFL